MSGSDSDRALRDFVPDVLRAMNVFTIIYALFRVLAATKRAE
jgi:hypothetical protein